MSSETNDKNNDKTNEKIEDTVVEKNIEKTIENNSQTNIDSKNTSVLSCCNLSREYQDGDRVVSVLRDVNLSFSSGEMVAIVGASGSGKSTLLHLLGGLDQPSAGEVWVAGERLDKMTEKQKSHWRNQHLGFVYQFHHLLPEFNVMENIAMPLLIRGSSPRQAQKAAEEICEHIGIQQQLHKRVQNLSGGERQRVAIARALVTKPKCVLADEPTGNLDLQTAEDVFATMCELNSTLDTCFVLVTHDPQLAKRMQRVLVLRDGELQV